MPINSFLYPAKNVPVAYEVANSCRFNDDDSPRLLIANPTAGTRTKGTFSTWFKRCTLGANQYLFSTWNNSTSGYSSAMILLQSDDRLSISNYVASGASGSSTLITERVFRDVSAWYHVCVNWDTTESETDRYKIYVNGTRETVFNGTPAYPTSSQDLFFNAGGTSNPQHIGFESVGSDTKYFDGYLAETVHIEGNDLAADQFGEFDEDSPQIWKPIDVSGLTFGDEGFYLDYEDSGDLGDDESGNGNDFAETNLAATDQTTDTPTNSFCTMNPLDNYYGAGTFSEGNLKIVTLSSDYTYYTGTIGLTAGLWYFEAKLTATADDNQVHVGIAGRVTTNAQHELGHYNDTYAYYSADGDSRTNDGDTSYGTGFDTGDVLGVYIDLNANKLYFAKNGTVQNSGTGISITDPASVTAGAYFPAVGDWANQSCTWEVNFGNPSWSLSSAVADKNGYGSFEYNPSSGTFDSASKDFLAICTKNLGSDGG